VVIGITGLLLIGLLSAAGYWLYLGNDLPWVGDDDLPRPTAVVATPAPGESPVPTQIGQASPTPSLLATVAVVADDTIESCLTRNLSPALLLSLYRDDTRLSNEIIRVCLDTQLPGDVIGISDPIIRKTSDCAAEVAQSLTTEEVLILGQEGNNAEKDAVTRRVVLDILACVAEDFDIPTG
jgi:hypothetical protein